MHHLRIRKAQARTFEALLAVVIVFSTLSASMYVRAAYANFEPFAPHVSGVTGGDGAQTLLDYLVYTGTLSWGLNHPSNLASLLDTYLSGEPWRLTVYEIQPKQQLLLSVSSGNPGPASAAALLYHSALEVAYLSVG